MALNKNENSKAAHPAGEDKKTLRVLFCGLGSIGTRHLQNLHTVAAQKGLAVEAHALRSGAKGPLPAATAALITRELASLPVSEDGARQPLYDVAFITNPTSLHFETLCALRGRADTLLIEKPIFDAACGMDLQTCLAPGQKAYVAAPMRWCGTMLALKEVLPTLHVYSARALCSSYLPDWRPGVDYRTVYSAHKTMGGGVAIDLIHEWDYLAELFGMPQACYSFNGTYSHLEIDSDDIAVYIARYPKLLCEVHLDYFGRSYRRTLELLCEKGTVVADFGAGTLTLEDGTVRHCEEPVNERYLREMAYVIEYALHGAGASLNTPQTALEVLKLTRGEQ